LSRKQIVAGVAANVTIFGFVALSVVTNGIFLLAAVGFFAVACIFGIAASVAGESEDGGPDWL